MLVKDSANALKCINKRLWSRMARMEVNYILKTLAERLQVLRFCVAATFKNFVLFAVFVKFT